MDAPYVPPPLAWLALCKLSDGDVEPVLKCHVTAVTTIEKMKMLVKEKKGKKTHTRKLDSN
jgi:hypothetical protein